jgi:hypothetical protein
MAAITGAKRDSAKTQRVQVAFEPSVFSLELMGGGDSLRFRERLVRFGFVDVTPPIANPASGELKIPTELFKSKMPRASWSGYWHALRADWRVQTATWVCLSGHHGRARATTPADSAAEINAVKQTGFFNAPFHDHEWKDEGLSHDESIFVHSSSARKSDYEDPPEYGAPFAVNRRCAGVFLSGCNTLSYPATRRWVRKTFPFAIVFGFIDRTKFGIHNVAPLLGTGAAGGKPGQQHGFLGKEAVFWRNPITWITEQANEAGHSLEAQAELMVAEMNRIYHGISGKGRDFAMIFGDDIYFVNSKDAKVERLRYDFEW